MYICTILYHLDTYSDSNFDYEYISLNLMFRVIQPKLTKATFDVPSYHNRSFYPIFKIVPNKLRKLKL